MYREGCEGIASLGIKRKKERKTHGDIGGGGNGEVVKEKDMVNLRDLVFQSTYTCSMLFQSHFRFFKKGRGERGRK